MKLNLLIATLGFIGALANVANAQHVTFVNAKDALIGKCFNPAANLVDISNPNRLLVGVHSDLERNSCIASTGAYYSRNLSDAMTFDVVAPEGYYVSKIKYSIVITKFVGRTGVATIDNKMIVAGNPLVLPSTGTFQVDLSTSSQHLTTVPVSISMYAFVSSTGNIGGGTASLTFPVIEAEILPLP